MWLSLRGGACNRWPRPSPHHSGAVVTLECVEKLIRKDMVDPVNGEKLTDRDIIVLQRVSRGPSTRLPPSPLCKAPPLTCPLPTPIPDTALLPKDPPSLRPTPPHYPGPAPAFPGLGDFLSHVAGSGHCHRSPQSALTPAFPLPQGGTGFAGSGVKLQAEKSRPVMQA